MINLWLEVPPGALASSREFLPNTEMRFVGQVKGFLGIGEPLITVDIDLKKSGQTIDRFTVKTNWQGMYWADTKLATTGPYTVQATFDPTLGSPEISELLPFTITQVPSGIGPQIEADVSPLIVRIPAQAKMTCSVYLDGLPEADVLVGFYLQNPTPPSDKQQVTDARGVAWVLMPVDALGIWAAEVYVPKYSFSKKWQVSGIAPATPVAPDEKGATPPPTKKTQLFGQELPEWAVPAAIGGAVALVAVAVLTRSK